MSDSTVSLNLQQQRKRAKELLKCARASDADAIARLKRVHPDVKLFQLAHAQLAVAREAGFESWGKLVKQLEARELETIAAAIHSGDADTVRKLLAGSAGLRRKINDPFGPFGQRAVHVAAKHRAVLDVLMEFGADINARSNWDKGPYRVLDECDEDTARYLITRGAILTAHAAARLGWFDELRKLVEANPQVVHEKGGDGQRPLHLAKTAEIVDFLLDHGADINAKCDDHHSTPAQYALAERPDVCRRLLERGAIADIFMPARLGDIALAGNIIAADPSSLAARTRLANYPPVHPFGIYLWTLGFFTSPHDVALKYEHRDVYDLLMRKSSPKVRMLNALMRGDRNAARELHDSGIELSREDHAMLAIAAFHELHEPAMLMLELGFDPTVAGIDGGSALHAAAWVGDAELVDAILRTGKAHLNERDPEHGSTPLGWAAYGSAARRARGGDYVRVIERLAAAGANLHGAGNKNGTRFIDMANGNAPVQDALRRLGAR